MQNMFKISGNTQNFPEFHQFYELGSKFLPFAQEKLGFNKPVGVNLVSDPENAKDPLGKTAYYDPNQMKITLFVDKRHVKDILRSLSHELVHHTQNCRGDFKGVNIGEGSFTTNKGLQELELQAYAEGNGRLVREFEEYMKNKNSPDINLQENQVINESWFNFVSTIQRWVAKRMNELAAEKKGSPEAKEKEKLLQQTMDEIECKVRAMDPEMPNCPGDPVKKEVPRGGRMGVPGKEGKPKYLYEINYLLKQGTLKENNIMSEKNKKSIVEALPSETGTKKMPPGIPEPKERDPKPVEVDVSCHKKGEECDIGDDGMGYQWNGVWKAKLECFKAYDCDTKMMKKSGGSQVSAPARKKRPPIKEETNENWFKGNKDQLLFESLVKKWTK